MIDIERQVAHWRSGAEEDWAVAVELLGKGRIRHGMFFLHLAVEKALKASVCRRTEDLAPRIHNLVRLAEVAALDLDQNRLDILAELNAFNVEGRYPDLLAPLPTQEEAQSYLDRATGVFRWLIDRL